MDILSVGLNNINLDDASFNEDDPKVFFLLFVISFYHFLKYIH